MGCAQGSQSKPATPKSAQNGAGGKTSNQGQEMRLLEEYSVGQTLGEGAFGVVSNCRKRSTGEEFAVKMVDKVETPVDAIKKEAEMMQSMDHPNIVKVHGVFYERCFVCIVMDKFSGGDLVEGLQRHLKERGQIMCNDVVHVARQMGASIQYLHRRTVVHRDIKGDNYLMDRKDMTDQKCRIVLTDFGTAFNVGPEERLSAGVGTKIFWAPEFFDRDYGAKVDVWAMGIIMYGLVSGRFPFRDENDIRTKEVKVPKRVHPVCEEFIKKMLDKVEKSRPSADLVMAHPWVSENGRQLGGGSSASLDDKDEGGQELREDVVNDGIKERRQELINRLNREHQVKGKEGKRSPGSGNHYMNKTFVLADKQIPGMKLTYEWWDGAKAKATGLLDPEGMVKPASHFEAGQEGNDLKMFSRMLEDHNIDPSQFGKGQAKKLEGLAAEVLAGAARLMLDATEHKKLVRVADVVVLRLRSPGQPRLLIEVSELMPDGRKRNTVRLPGTKKEPHENTRQTAERILQEMLGIAPTSVKFDLGSIERFEEEMDSPSYPGVRTVYRKEIIEGVVSTMDKVLLEKVGLPGIVEWNAADKQGNTKFFQWMTDKEAESKKVKLKAEASEAVSTLVRAPIGFNEEALRAHLKSLGVDPERFGKDGAKTIKEFSAELIRGESALVQVGGKLQRVVDVVLMVVRNPTSGEVLVQSEQVDSHGHKTRLDRLPGAKCRPDENQFLSARRILRRQLEIDENQVRLDRDVTFIEEEKPSSAYPGLKTVYRKRMIRAELQTIGT
mmetsp:Transcript_60680/g.159540  ORF Transcript_60680/g.159540 Transcript_60680/m.159540 type:complete len:780 (-) Transcript_60680:278-2617(-)